MPTWFTGINSDFRQQLNTPKKSYKAIANKCLLMQQTLQQLKQSIPLVCRQSFSQPTEELFNDNIFYFWYEMNEKIEECMQHFDFCNELANHTIKQEEWENYDFDGDLVGLFNEYLNEFWNICDTNISIPHYQNRNNELKFCWVAL